MIYSTFDWNSGLYYYFEGPGEGLGVRPVGKDHNDAAGKGHKLEDLLPVIPAGSKHIGRGPSPRGRVAMLHPSLRAQLATTGGAGNEAIRQITGFGGNDSYGAADFADSEGVGEGVAADDAVSWWPTYSTCEEAYPVAGYSDFAADIQSLAAQPQVTGNPLVDSPWLTLGLWAGAVYGLYWLAAQAGRHVAGK